MELKSGRPRHEQISDWLRQQIEEGAYEVDEKLPSENELGDRFDVSRVTVRRALQTLENEEYIYRRQGLGSFVKEQRAAQGLVRLTDFAQDMAQAGLEASSVVEHQAPESPPPKVAVHLDTEDEKVMRLDRLRLGDGSPVAFDRTWLPMFYAQLLEGHDLEHETIYHILEAEYDIPVLRGHYRITAANAGPSVAESLGIDEGTAARSPTIWLPPYYRPFYDVPYSLAVRIAASLAIVVGVLRADGAVREVTALGFAAVPLLAPLTYAYYFVAAVPAVVLLVAAELDRPDGRPALPVVGLLLIQFHSYGLRWAGMVAPEWLPGVLLQPGLYGNLLVVGLAGARVAAAGGSMPVRDVAAALGRRGD